MILGIDQGTTGTTAVVFDDSLDVVSKGYAAVQRRTPRPGRVEVSPQILLESVQAAVESVLEHDRVDAAAVDVVGFTNQGETSMCWDEDGSPLHEAIVWQDNRTAERCAELEADDDFAAYVRETTGLRIDPYFSATKLEWLLDAVDDPGSGSIRYGTTDSWLLERLVEGSPHVTDHATASRTMLFDVHALEWDRRLLDAFGLDEAALPEALPNDEVVGRTDPERLCGIDAPVAGCIVDQQAALYGQGCVDPGDAKCTYGTGSFLLMNTGQEPVVDADGVLGTVGWTIDGETAYALDGGVYTTGAFVDWLVNELDLVESPRETETMATGVSDSGGVCVVPALTGLAAPYWDSAARGAILGLDSSTTHAHVVRASLEGIAHRIRDVVEAMTDGAGRSIETLKVDGGLTNNDFLLRYQSDVLDHPLSVSSEREATALGTAALAARSVGIEVDEDRLGSTEETISPTDSTPEADRNYRRWRRAVELVRRWDE